MATRESLPQPEFVSPYAAEVEVRNKRICNKIGGEAAEKFAQILAPYEDLLPRTSAEVQEILHRKHAETCQEAMEKRLSGQLNDLESKKPGIFITGILDYRAIEKLRENLEILPIKFELNVPPTGHYEQPYSLFLPYGIFRYGSGSELDLDLQEMPHSQQWLYISSFREKEDGSLSEQSSGFGFHWLKGGSYDKSVMGGMENVTTQGYIHRVEGVGGTLWIPASGPKNS